MNSIIEATPPFQSWESTSNSTVSHRSTTLHNDYEANKDAVNHKQNQIDNIHNRLNYLKAADQWYKEMQKLVEKKELLAALIKQKEHPQYPQFVLLHERLNKQINTLILQEPDIDQWTGENRLQTTDTIG